VEVWYCCGIMLMPKEGRKEVWKERKKKDERVIVLSSVDM